MTWLLFALLAQAPADAGAFSSAPPPPELGSAAPWTFLEEQHGVRVEQRAVKDSGYQEYRATTVTPLPVEALCPSVFDWGSYAAHDEVSVRRLLAERADVRVVYDQVQQAVVSNRDYAMTQTRVAGPGRCAIRFWATNDVAPPRAPGTVRIERLWGAWDFEASDAGTSVRYVVFSDPAGALPPFLVHGAQREGIVKTLGAELERARVGKRPPHP